MLPATIGTDEGHSGASGGDGGRDHEPELASPVRRLCC